MHLVLLTLGGIGHVILWVALVNRIHGLGIHRRWVNQLTILCGLMFLFMPVAVAAGFIRVLAPRPTLLYNSLYAAAWTYIAGCAVLCIVATVQRWRWRRDPSGRNVIVSNHTKWIRVADHVTEPLAAPGVVTWLTRLPGNEALSVCVQEKQLVIPRLPRQYQGLRIVHLTDLHMSGRIGRAYFEFVMQEVNRCEPDIVAITGDLIERNACLDWIPSTFGQLRAPGGIFYVLGNHDRRVDQRRLKESLANAGLSYLGGTCREVTVRGLPILLAGNELPWYRPAADLSDCPPRKADGLPLRVLLAHTPDQLPWAQANDIDLMLAGHLHGGQVCLPLLGAITSPSFHGVRFAAGAFQSGNTVLHVSRGTSSLTPVRWNCPPEIAFLKLQAVHEAG